MAKLLLAAIIPLAGAGAIGVFSEYATYNYAVHYGFRPSFEGVPYLKATVTLASFCILFFGAFAFAGIVLMFRSYLVQLKITEKTANWLARRIASTRFGSRISTSNPSAFIDVRKSIENISSRPSWVVIAALSVTLLVTIFISYFIIWSMGDGLDWKGRLAVSSGFTILAFLVLSCLIWEKLVWLYATMGAIIAIITTICLMFDAERYAEFLRMVGYGGGIPVRIIQGADSNAKITIDGYLLLRTTDSFMMFDKKSGIISEFPREGATEVRHAAGGLRSLPFVLPKSH